MCYIVLIYRFRFILHTINTWNHLCLERWYQGCDNRFSSRQNYWHSSPSIVYDELPLYFIWIDTICLIKIFTDIYNQIKSYKMLFYHQHSIVMLHKLFHLSLNDKYFGIVQWLWNSESIAIYSFWLWPALFVIGHW